MDTSDILLIVWLIWLMGVIFMAVLTRRRMRAVSEELADQLTQMAAAASTFASTTLTVSGNFFVGGPLGHTEPEPADAFWTPEPILAWRHYRVRTGIPYLDSMTRGTYKPNGPATCQGGLLGHSHESPHWQCSCGYYALKDLPHGWGNGEEEDMFSDGDVVFAAVHLSGRVIEHERGYRAQYIKPIAVTRHSATLMHLNGMQHLLTTANPDHPIITDDIEAVHHEHNKRKENYGPPR